jgi:hypothetical protein
MTTRIDAWLDAAIADATRRGLPGLAPLLETMAKSTAALREADREAREAGESLPGQSRIAGPER